MKRYAAHGFTLIELLVVITILGVVTTLGTVTMVRMWEQWSTLKLAVNLDHTAENIFQTMHDDFASAVNSDIAGAALTGSRGIEEDKQFYGQKLASDSFTLPVEVPGPNGATTILAGYRIDRSNGASTLVRTEQLLRDGGEPRTQPLAEGILQLHVEYANAGGTWSENWAEPGNPRAVRVSLLLVDPANPLRQQVARSAVFTVNVP